MLTESKTAKVTITIEFQKYGLRPSQLTAMQAEDHACIQGSIVGCLGSVRMVLFSKGALPRISGMVFNEVKIIAITGIRKNTADAQSVA